MRFINIQSFKQLFQIGSMDEAITSVAICPKGRHIVAIMDSGALNIYSVQGLTQEVNKVAYGPAEHTTISLKSQSVRDGLWSPNVVTN